MRTLARAARTALLGAICAVVFGIATAGPAAAATLGAAEVPAKFIGYEPDSLLARLATIDSATIARACGTICAPWAYRGPLGRENSMRSYGRHHANGVNARVLADLLLQSATIDTASKIPSTSVTCEPALAEPIYLVAFHCRGRDTFALLRFDLGAALFFDAEEPLGMVMMRGVGDSLWAALGQLLDDDPLLRKDRPRRAAGITADSLKGDFANVDSLPSILARVRPSYPSVARVMNISGLVVIQALVGKDGAVKDAFVITGHPVFRDDALEAVWQWRFKPASHGGEPVAVWVAIPVRFTLQ